MIRVLQCVNNMHRAGLETMLMNYFRQMDRDLIRFDFLTHRPQKADYDDEIRDLGGNVYYAPRLYPQNYPAYFRYMRNFFREHPEYRIIHSHIDAMSYLPLAAAKAADVPVRIAHSHNTGIDPDFKYPMKMLFRQRLPHVATDYLACGTEAGRFLFGDRDFTVIPNAVDSSAFRFSQETRDRVRKELNLEGHFVMGSVGRLTYQKNLTFLLQVFHRIHEDCPEALLLIIGGGEQETELKEMTRTLGIDDRVRFLGVRDDVAQLYQAMDIFVMPSRYEGLPVVGVEAQFSGLPCVFSGEITRELRISDKAWYLSIERSPDQWAEFILRLKKRYSFCGSDDRISAQREADPECRKMDIAYTKDILQNYYLEKWSTL